MMAGDFVRVYQKPHGRRPRGCSSTMKRRGFFRALLGAPLAAAAAVREPEFDGFLGFERGPLRGVWGLKKKGSKSGMPEYEKIHCRGCDNEVEEVYS